MQEIKCYKLTWRPCDNAGQLHFGLADGSGASVPLDTPQEASMLIDVLRHESPVYWDAKHSLMMTGFEPVGEGEADADNDPTNSAAADVANIAGTG